MIEKLYAPRSSALAAPASFQRQAAYSPRISSLSPCRAAPPSRDLSRNSFAKFTNDALVGLGSLQQLYVTPLLCLVRPVSTAVAARCSLSPPWLYTSGT